MEISVIIPHRNSTSTLSRLLDSIPYDDDVEVIVVDNSVIKVCRDDICSKRKYTLIYSDPNKGAGCARNVGLSIASGKWVFFADADDYFSAEAFLSFQKYYSSANEIVFFKSRGIYDDTGEPSQRSDHYNRLIDEFVEDDSKEINLRLLFSVPWAKLIKKDLIDRHNISFEEILASNDINFSVKTGYYAKKVAIDNTVVYIVTTNRGSLTNRKDINTIRSRYSAYIRRNRFLKENGLGSMQQSVMYFIYIAFQSSSKHFLSFLAEAIRERQNIFIGYSKWLMSFISSRNKENTDKKYIVK